MFDDNFKRFETHVDADVRAAGRPLRRSRPENAIGRPEGPPAFIGPERPPHVRTARPPEVPQGR